MDNFKKFLGWTIVGTIMAVPFYVVMVVHGITVAAGLFAATAGVIGLVVLAAMLISGAL